MEDIYKTYGGLRTDRSFTYSLEGCTPEDIRDEPCKTRLRELIVIGSLSFALVITISALVYCAFYS